jgi:hypothetical protein
MPQKYRRGSQIGRMKPSIGNYYRPVKRPSPLSQIVFKIKKLPKRFLLIVGSLVIVVALVITGICLLSGKGSTTTGGDTGGKTAKPAPTPTSTDLNIALPQRASALDAPLVTPEPNAVRDLSFGASDMQFKEKLINQPSLSGNELFYSAGSGSLDTGEVLKKLYLYNIDTGKEQAVTGKMITGGGYYETQMNKDWLVWLVTDHHTFNYIYVKNRHTNDEPVKIKNCPNGKPKLRLAGNTLIWMEAVDKGKDQLMMYDLLTQDNMSLFTFTDVVTYGVSAPCIYVAPSATAAGSPAPQDSPSPTPSPTPTPSPSPTPTVTPTGTATQGDDIPVADDSPDSTELTTVVWAGPDASQTDAQKTSDGEHSTIYWVDLGKDAIDENGNIKKSSFSPGTYVHEPLYNGKYFAWIDGNYSPNSKLYLSEPNGTPKMIDQGITTYSLGDGILVYGKSQQVWVYIIATGEYCRLTSSMEKGMLPSVDGRTVVWYDKTSNSAADTLRYKVLTDKDLLPGAN